MTQHVQPKFLERMTMMGAGMMGFAGEQETLRAIEEHVKTQHMIGFGNWRRGIEIQRHYAAMGRGEITLDNGKIVIKKT